MKRATFALGASAALGTSAFAASAPRLDAAQSATLSQFLNALRARRYDRAFALLSAEERHYFRTSANYASIYAADRLTIGAWTVVRVEPTTHGTFVAVSEAVSFFDHAHQVQGTAKARVGYGIVREGRAVRIKDPYHPWRAFVPENALVAANGLSAAVRKVSFFTGRVELLITFVNTGDGTVTLLPYGRSVLRDDRGAVHQIVDTRLAGLTDRNLRLGLRLAGSATYTGALTFFTPDRFEPRSLTLTIAPMLRDGADAPFSLQLPEIVVRA